jgi:hypothetical protein
MQKTWNESNRSVTSYVRRQAAGFHEQVILWLSKQGKFLIHELNSYLLNSLTPLSLLSGATIDLNKVLKKASKHEYHHIFPKKHLEREGFARNEINTLSNICFLTRADNNSIKDAAPSVYGAKIDSDRKNKYLQKALIPGTFESLNYNDFIASRTALLEQRAKDLMA